MLGLGLKQKHFIETMLIEPTMDLSRFGRMFNFPTLSLTDVFWMQRDRKVKLSWLLLNIRLVSAICWLICNSTFRVLPEIGRSIRGA